VAEAPAAVVVVGIGNALRGDDAAGLQVARGVRSLLEPVRARLQIAVLEHEREPLGLIDRWQGASATLLIDAICSGAQPGTTHRIDVSAAPIPAPLGSSSSTHAVGLGEAIELARALGRLPATTVLYGIEGASFDSGYALSSPVGAAVPTLAEAVAREAIQAAATAA